MTGEPESLTDARTSRDERTTILLEVACERERQDAKWGGLPGFDRRDDHTYAAVLGEEFGECCKAWLERDVRGLRAELIQTAAVAVAWIEELDNGGAVPRPVVGKFVDGGSVTFSFKDGEWAETDRCAPGVTS